MISYAFSCCAQCDKKHSNRPLAPVSRGAQACTCAAAPGWRGRGPAEHQKPWSGTLALRRRCQPHRSQVPRRSRHLLRCPPLPTWHPPLRKRLPNLTSYAKSGKKEKATVICWSVVYESHLDVRAQGSGTGPASGEHDLSLRAEERPARRPLCGPVAPLPAGAGVTCPLPEGPGTPVSAHTDGQQLPTY